MSFDLNAAQLNETATFQLEHPINGPIFAGPDETLPVMVEVYGKSSKVFRNYMATQNKKNAIKQRTGKADKAPTADEVLESNSEFYATLVKSITNLTMNGEPVDNFDSYKAMFANPKLSWVGEQINEKFNEVEAFLSE